MAFQKYFPAGCLLNTLQKVDWIFHLSWVFWMHQQVLQKTFYFEEHWPDILVSSKKLFRLLLISHSEHWNWCWHWAVLVMKWHTNVIQWRERQHIIPTRKSWRSFCWIAHSSFQQNFKNNKENQSNQSAIHCTWISCWACGSALWN